MATNTINYNLVKPDLNETADIQVINDNMDIIDSAIQETLDQFDTLSTNLTALDSDLEMHKSDNVPHLGVTTNSGNVYSVTTTKTVDTNQKFTVQINVAATGVSTLSVSTIASGAAKIVYKANSTTQATLKAGYYYMIYDGTAFTLLGEGGEYGTATATEVLSGYTIGTENGIVNGTYGASMNAGDNYIVASNNVTTMVNTAVYTKKYEIRMEKSGTVRVKFAIKSSNTSGAYAKVYINGVVVGTTRTNSTTSYVYYTEDFTVNIGDLVQLYIASTSTNTATANYFGIGINSGFEYATIIL